MYDHKRTQESQEENDLQWCVVDIDCSQVGAHFKSDLMQEI